MIAWFGQWESAERIGGFIAGEDAAEDPLWARSGAADAAEYARWAEHLCGVACLRMVLSARGVEVRAFDLMRALRARGGYVEEAEGGAIRGLIYAPAVALLAEAYGIAARVDVDVGVEAVASVVREGGVFIASVHPAIRLPAQVPPHRGGHLVLVHGVASEGGLVFHNPSGDAPATQRDVVMAGEVFGRFFAGRGIAVTALRAAPAGSDGGDGGDGGEGSGGRVARRCDGILRRVCHAAGPLGRSRVVGGSASAA